MFVSLFVCPIITQEPQTDFPQALIAETRESHRNVIAWFKNLDWVGQLLLGKKL